MMCLPISFTLSAVVELARRARLVAAVDQHIGRLVWILARERDQEAVAVADAVHADHGAAGRRNERRAIGGDGAEPARCSCFSAACFFAQPSSWQLSSLFLRDFLLGSLLRGGFLLCLLGRRLLRLSLPWLSPRANAAMRTARRSTLNRAATGAKAFGGLRPPSSSPACGRVRPRQPPCPACG